MTWSIANTITYNTNADNHTAMLYLFDTVLAGKTGWTISAHPDSSAFKRRAKFTATSRITNSNFSFYHWINWFSTSPTSYSWYEDATYTTTIGDTANDQTTLVDGSGVTWQGAGENWKFCVSSENSQSVLVLKGGKVAFYWPGITEGVFWPDPAWVAGTADNKGTWICPAVGSSANNLYTTNAPGTIGTSSQEYGLVPDAGYAPSGTTTSYRYGGNYIATNFNWLYTQTTTSPQPDLSSSIAFSNGGHSDVGVWIPSALTNSSDSRLPFSTVNGVTMQIGSNYWYNSFTDLGRQGLVFNFGAVDPLA